MIVPNKQTFLRDAESFSVIPVSKEIRADFETPLSIFLKSGGMFLLESIERGEHVGRYSFIACGKKSEISIRDRRIVIREKNGDLKTVAEASLPNPLEELRRYFQSLKSPVYEHLPPFFGGAIGYFGYETVQYFEQIPTAVNDSSIPDALLIIPETLLVYDSVKRSIFIITAVYPKKNPEKEYEEAADRIESIERILSPPIAAAAPRRGGEKPVLRPETSPEKFKEGVEAGKKYIREGDIYQVVLSQRFAVDLDVDPFAVYQALRMINPSPYLFYLDFDEFTLIGSSPEVMVRKQNRELLIKPLAGTRPRGGTVAEDDLLARELLSDPKEKAEQIMLVDLARNDLGRLAKPGSVDVVDYMSVERYSHVMHIVSSVKAELAEPYDIFDVIRAVFPAGTLSGAPKIRAMEIISELEGTRRGVYGGMVCYLGFNGNFDSCITIRTILMQGKTAFIQAGAGIVADSVPENEYRESCHKAQALFQAIERASQEQGE
ncbi:MAG: anthranilate synthase component I [Candidatus Aminicenantes bacterium]|nr:anthranilate synthase component I [Candidatus Aminicenantes bacterium]